MPRIDEQTILRARRNVFRSYFFSVPEPSSDAPVHKYFNRHERQDLHAQCEPRLGMRTACGSVDPDHWWTWHWKAATCPACLKHKPSVTTASLVAEVAGLRKQIELLKKKGDARRRPR